MRIISTYPYIFQRILAPTASYSLPLVANSLYCQILFTSSLWIPITGFLWVGHFIMNFQCSFHKVNSKADIYINFLSTNISIFKIYLCERQCNIYMEFYELQQNIPIVLMISPLWQHIHYLVWTNPTPIWPKIEYNYFLISHKKLGELWTTNDIILLNVLMYILVQLSLPQYTQIK